MNRLTASTLLQGRSVLVTLLCAAAVTACGGNDFVESLVKLITARFVPPTVAVARGTAVTVTLEVTCDREGLETPFGRLAIEIKLDTSHLPAGVTATSSPADDTGFVRIPCNGTTGDPNLRMAQLPVRIAASAEAANSGSGTLSALVQIEPLANEPSKDSTQAQMTVTVSSASVPG